MPVARLVAPGPSVAMQSPGAPVMRPVTSAAKPAEPSCAVRTNSTPPWRIASISGSTLPLGMPKPRLMPADFNVATIRSALFMGWCGGTSVAMQSPGAPVMRPVTSAAKPAEPSCAVSTKSTPPWRIASISGSTLPLGMPKPRVMPADFNVATIRSALFMGWCGGTA